MFGKQTSKMNKGEGTIFNKIGHFSTHIYVNNGGGKQFMEIKFETHNYLFIVRKQDINIYTQSIVKAQIN